MTNRRTLVALALDGGRTLAGANARADIWTRKARSRAVVLYLIRDLVAAEAARLGL